MTKKPIFIKEEALFEGGNRANPPHYVAESAAASNI